MILVLANKAYLLRYKGSAIFLKYILHRNPLKLLRSLLIVSEYEVHYLLPEVESLYV